jgi:hypothetical protein
MEPGISVRRMLPIDATLLSAVLLRLRREVAGRPNRWTLGDRGAMDVDVHFTPTASAPGVYGPAWATTGRLWDPEQLALATLTIELIARAADQCELQLTATELTPWWQERVDALTELAHAALDELAEEMLWHATRRDIANTEA